MCGLYPKFKIISNYASVHNILQCCWLQPMFLFVSLPTHVWRTNDLLERSKLGTFGNLTCSNMEHQWNDTWSQVFIGSSSIDGPSTQNAMWNCQRVSPRTEDLDPPQCLHAACWLVSTSFLGWSKNPLSLGVVAALDPIFFADSWVKSMSVTATWFLCLFLVWFLLHSWWGFPAASNLRCWGQCSQPPMAIC